MQTLLFHSCVPSLRFAYIVSFGVYQINQAVRKVKHYEDKIDVLSVKPLKFHGIMIIVLSPSMGEGK